MDDYCHVVGTNLKEDPGMFNGVIYILRRRLSNNSTCLMDSCVVHSLRRTLTGWLDVFSGWSDIPQEWLVFSLWLELIRRTIQRLRRSGSGRLRYQEK